MIQTSPSNSVSLSLGVNNRVVSTSEQVQKFLQFQLGKSDCALLEAEIVTEIITISTSQILPVPQMIYSILGVYSWRSEILWIVDLENLLGYPPSLSSKPEVDSLLVMVVQNRGQALGLVVPQVDNIIEQDLEQLKSPSSELFPKDLVSFLRGYFTNSKNDIIMSIDIAAIFNFFAFSI